MSTKKKLLISLGSLCLVAAIVVVGVFAAVQQTFTVTSKISYVAKGVAATISTGITNNGTAVEVTGGTNTTLSSTSVKSDEDKNTTGSFKDMEFVLNKNGTVGEIVITTTVTAAADAGDFVISLTKTPETINNVTVSTTATKGGDTYVLGSGVVSANDVVTIVTTYSVVNSGIDVGNDGQPIEIQHVYTLDLYFAD